MQIKVRCANEGDLLITGIELGPEYGRLYGWPTVSLPYYVHNFRQNIRLKYVQKETKLLIGIHYLDIVKYCIVFELSEY